MHFGLKQEIPFPQNLGEKGASLLLYFFPLIFWSEGQVLGRAPVKTSKDCT